MKEERIQKIIGRSGVMSRRRAEQLIASGRVTADGKLVHLGERARVDQTLIAIDGIPIPIATGRVTYLLNKPVGVISSRTDPQRRPTVTDLVPDTPAVYPVGRLDQDSSGLILLSNDGELTNRITHPRYGMTKTYTVLCQGKIRPRTLRTLQEGVQLEDGIAQVLSARIAGRSAQTTLLELKLGEGRNREIRRLLDAVGHPVLSLTRRAIGTLTDSSLGPGQYRRLSPSEVADLYAQTQNSSVPPPPTETDTSTESTSTPSPITNPTLVQPS